MSYIDIAILIPLLYAAYKGFRKGLIIEIATLVALIVGIYGAIHFSIYTEGILGDNTEIDESYLPLVAMVLTFLGIVIGIHFLAKLLEKVVKLVALGLVNRIFGMVFSLVKMSLIISFILVFINSMNDKLGLFSKEAQQSSYLVRAFFKCWSNDFTDSYYFRVVQRSELTKRHRGRSEFGRFGLKI